MTVGFRDARSQQTGATPSQTIAYPAASISGDLLILAMINQLGDGAATLPTGWTQILRTSIVEAVPGNGDDSRPLVMWRIRGAETSVTISNAGDSDVCIAAYSNAQIVVTPTTTVATDTTSSAPTAPTITATTTQNVLVSIMTGRGNNTSGTWLGNSTNLTQPSGMTFRIGRTTATSEQTVGIADELRAATGATGTRAWAMAPSPVDAYASVSILLQSPPAVPNAPVALTPDGQSFDRTGTFNFSYLYTDPNGDPQTALTWEYKLSGSGTWIPVTPITTATPGFTPAAGFFPAGTYDWHVKASDATGYSAFSSTATFTALDPPTAAVITAPTSLQVITGPAFTTTWTVTNQSGYQAQRVRDNAGVIDPSTVYSDSGQLVGGASASVRSLPLTFDTTGRFEWVRVRISYGGIWSAWTSVRVQVAYVNPATPVVTATANAVNGYVTVGITNPTPTGGQPTVTSQQVYRTAPGGTEQLLGTGLPAGTPYLDRTASAGVAYTYRVVSVGSNGTTSTATTSALSPTLKLSGYWLHDPASPSTTQLVLPFDGLGRSDTITYEQTVRHFAGRALPVAEFGLSVDRVIVFTTRFRKGTDDALAVAFGALLARRTTLAYRDGRGRSLFGVVSVLPLVEDSFGAQFQITFTATDYTGT